MCLPIHKALNKLLICLIFIPSNLLTLRSSLTGMLTSPCPVFIVSVIKIFLSLVLVSKALLHVQQSKFPLCVCLLKVLLDDELYCTCQALYNVSICILLYNYGMYFVIIRLYCIVTNDTYHILLFGCLMLCAPVLGFVKSFMHRSATT